MNSRVCYSQNLLRLGLFSYLPISTDSGTASSIFYTPIRGITATSFSSAFGPRDVGSDEYPNSGYDYDFHAAIDIASSNGTSIYPVVSGTVTEVGTLGSQEDYIIVKSQRSDNTYFLVKYLHVRHSVKVNDNVTAGNTNSTVLGTIVDYGAAGSSGDHLDIRYYPDGKVEAHDKNADNPGKVLSAVSNNTFNDSDPTLLDADGSTIPMDGSCSMRTKTDPSTFHNNPANASYVTFAAQINKTALSILWIKLDLTGESGGLTYNTSDLLNNYLNEPVA